MAGANSGIEDEEVGDIAESACSGAGALEAARNTGQAGVGIELVVLGLALADSLDEGEVIQAAGAEECRQAEVARGHRVTAGNTSTAIVVGAIFAGAVVLAGHVDEPIGSITLQACVDTAVEAAAVEIWAEGDGLAAGSSAVDAQVHSGHTDTDIDEGISHEVHGCVTDAVPSRHLHDEVVVERALGADGRLGAHKAPIDIAGDGSRVRVQVVAVCCFTRSIHQFVVQEVIAHGAQGLGQALQAARHGVPAQLWVRCGIQVVA